MSLVPGAWGDRWLARVPGKTAIARDLHRLPTFCKRHGGVVMARDFFTVDFLRRK
jgi:hypothetical protein